MVFVFSCFRLVWYLFIRCLKFVWYLFIRNFMASVLMAGCSTYLSLFGKTVIRILYGICLVETSYL